jgi:hypothetical protein
LPEHLLCRSRARQLREVRCWVLPSCAPWQASCKAIATDTGTQSFTPERLVQLTERRLCRASLVPGRVATRTASPLTRLCRWTSIHLASCCGSSGRGRSPLRASTITRCCTKSPAAPVCCGHHCPAARSGTLPQTQASVTPKLKKNIYMLLFRKGLRNFCLRIGVFWQLLFAKAPTFFRQLSRRSLIPPN